MAVQNLVMTLVGGAMVYSVKRRKFNRTNEFGSEGFKSFGSMSAIILVEKVATILGWVLLILGLFSFFTAWLAG